MYLNEVLVAVKIKIVVFWVITCNFVIGYQCFRRTCCLNLQDRRFYTTLKMEVVDSLEMLVTTSENYPVS
jgi:hypothetical protein